MANQHPNRKKAVFFLLLPFLLMGMGYLLRANLSYEPEDTVLERIGAIASFFGTFMGFWSLAPSIIIGLVLLFKKPKAQTTRPPKPGSVPVRAATGFLRFTPAFIPGFPGELSWSAGDSPSLKLTKDNKGILESIFDIPAKDVTKASFNPGSVSLTVHGKRYFINYRDFPTDFTFAINPSAAPGLLNSALGFWTDGINNLYDLLRNEGVQVSKPDLSKTFKYGLLVGYGLLAIFSITLGVLSTD